jgi:hypothetical protein
MRAWKMKRLRMYLWGVVLGGGLMVWPIAGSMPTNADKGSAFVGDVVGGLLVGGLALILIILSRTIADS